MNGAKMGAPKNISVLEYSLSKKTTSQDAANLKKAIEKAGFKVFTSSIGEDDFIIMFGSGFQPNLAINGDLNTNKIDLEGWVTE